MLGASTALLSTLTLVKPFVLDDEMLAESCLVCRSGSAQKVTDNHVNKERFVSVCPHFHALPRASRLLCQPV